MSFNPQNVADAFRLLAQYHLIDEQAALGQPARAVPERYAGSRQDLRLDTHQVGGGCFGVGKGLQQAGTDQPEAANLIHGDGDRCLLGNSS